MPTDISETTTFYIPYVDKTMEKGELIKTIQRSLKEYVEYYSMNSTTNPILKIEYVPRYDKDQNMFYIAFVHFKYPNIILQSHINSHHYYYINIEYMGYNATHIKLLNARNTKKIQSKKHYYQQQIEKLETENKALKDQLENYEDYCVISSQENCHNDETGNIEVNAKGYPTTGQLRIN
tara:strand:+ start:147 stop:683 length:537 start_codon:yes stop_codon:yes gene_type:complete